MKYSVGFVSAVPVMGFVEIEASSKEDAEKQATQFLGQDNAFDVEYAGAEIADGEVRVTATATPTETEILEVSEADEAEMADSE